MKRKILLFLVALALAVPALRAQTIAGGNSSAREAAFAIQYNVDSTSLTYCRMEGVTGDPYAAPKAVAQRIKTTGSSATVDEFVTAGAPFADVLVGDVLQIATPTATDPKVTTLRVVTAKASAAQITVDTAIDLSAAGGFRFSYWKLACGTSTAAGWIRIPPAAARFGMSLTFDQGDITTLVARWECKFAGDGAQSMIVYPGESSDCGPGATLATDRCSWPQAQAGTATGGLTVVDDAPVYTFCRVGLAYVTADTSDATTNREKVTVRLAIR